MTDKEQIMIDKVDVSRCRYFLKDTEGQDYETDEFVKGCCEAKGSCIGYEFAGYGLCRGDKDCYFKQLARKTQECEQKDKELLSNEKIINKLMKEVDELRQECEELKERASIAEDNIACEVQARLYHQNEWLKFSKECEELKKQLKTSEKWRINAESLNEKLDIENTRYRKALEEIKEIVSSTLDCGEWVGQGDDKMAKILDIIRRAKGEE